MINMRKSALFILTVLISLTASSQAQLKTKQYVISDFGQKAMKVVLTANELIDATFRESMQTVWNISPYEFCSEEEFLASTGSQDYYFMVLADSHRRRDMDDGITVIGIYKGAEGAKSLDDLYKVVSIPLCAAEDPDGREMEYLPALLNVLQNQVVSIMDRKINLSGGITVDLKTQTRKWDERCAIAREDFAEDPGISVAATYRHENIDVVDQETAISHLRNRSEGVLVGYVVAPSFPGKGSVCYNMLIKASTWEICYFKKRRIDSGVGFTQKDAAAIIGHKPSEK